MRHAPDMCVALDMSCRTRGDLYHIESQSDISNPHGGYIDFAKAKISTNTRRKPFLRVLLYYIVYPVEQDVRRGGRTHRGAFLHTMYQKFQKPLKYPAEISCRGTFCQISVLPEKVGGKSEFSLKKSLTLGVGCGIISTCDRKAMRTLR